MTACPACSGIADNVLACGDMCANVMKGCLAQYAALDMDWNQFVGEQFRLYLPPSLSLSCSRPSIELLYLERIRIIDARNLLCASKVFGSYAGFFCGNGCPSLASPYKNNESFILKIFQKSRRQYIDISVFNIFLI